MVLGLVASLLSLSVGPSFTARAAATPGIEADLIPPNETYAGSLAFGQDEPASPDDALPGDYTDAAPPSEDMNGPAGDSAAPTPAPASTPAPAPVSTLAPLPTPTPIQILVSGPPLSATLTGAATCRPMSGVIVLPAGRTSSCLGQALLPDPSGIDPHPYEFAFSTRVINRVPSPVGAPLFSSVATSYTDQSSSTALRLATPPYATYSYSCSVGQCSGSAKDVWCAMTDVQQQDYLTAFTQASRAEPPPAAIATVKAAWAQVTFDVTVVGGNTFSQKLSVANFPPDESVIRYSRYC